MPNRQGDMDSHPRFSEAYNAHQAGDYRTALRLFESLIDDAKDCADRGLVNLWIGICNIELERWELARDTLHRASDDLRGVTGAELQYLQTLHYLGEALFNLWEYVDSLRCLEEAENYIHHYHLPKWRYEYYDYRIRRGQVLSKLGRFQESLQHFYELRRVVNLTDLEEGHREMAQLMIGKEQYLMADYDNATETLKTVEPDALNQTYLDDYFLTMAGLCSATKQLDKAESYYRELERVGIRNDTAASAYYIAGTIHYQLGNRSLAEEFFQKSLRDPGIHPVLRKRILDHLDN